MDQRRVECDGQASTVVESVTREERERDAMFEKVLHKISELQGGQSRLLAGQGRVLQMLIQLVLDRDSMPDADYRKVVSEVETLVSHSKSRQQYFCRTVNLYLWIPAADRARGSPVLVAIRQIPGNIHDHNLLVSGKIKLCLQ
jgi:hypothetical protein